MRLQDCTTMQRLLVMSMSRYDTSPGDATAETVWAIWGFGFACAVVLGWMVG